MTKAFHAKKELRDVYVVLGTSESFMAVTDGYPYLQVQVIGKGFD